MEHRSQSPWVLERLVIGGLVRLQEGVTTIGRSATCTITVASDYVSRIHAELLVLPNSAGVQLRDLGSTNGVFVNDVLYKGATCLLQVGDRIGIGVSVEEDQISPDGRYPMYVLRLIPFPENNSVEAPETNGTPEVNLEINAPNSIPDDEMERPDKVVDEVESDHEYDDDDDVDDFVQPGIEILNEALGVSLSADAQLPNRDIVSENIKSIFGDLNSDILKNLSKETREIAAGNISKSVPVPKEVKDDVICISDDEEVAAVQRDNAKSPQLFGDSFNNDESATNDQHEKESSTNIFAKESDNSTTKDAIKQEPLLVSPKSEDIDEEEELYFTQQLLDDFREDTEVEVRPNYEFNQENDSLKSHIKEEIEIQEENAIINLDEDEEEDEDFDKALESKVNDWSLKLFSQSFTNNLNASQVYEEGEYDDEPAAITEGIFINIDDDDDDDDDDFGYKEKTSNGVEDIQIKQEIVEDISEEPSVSNHIIPTTSGREGELSLMDSPLVRQRKRISTSKYLLSSSSSEEDEEKIELQQEESSESSSSIGNHMQTIDEIPKKKPRLGNVSDSKNEEVPPIVQYKRKSGADLPKTYSKADQSDAASKEERSTEDLFDSLKKADKLPIDKNKQNVANDGSVVYRRSSSAVDEVKLKTDEKAYHRSTSANEGEVNKINKISKPFTDLRRKSFSKEDQADDDFEKLQSSKPAQSGQLKMLRGPPEIITPPQLPKTKGKLRGVSAVQQRLSDSIKAVQNQKELKSKWMEKPSIAKRKEKQKLTKMKEERKLKLKELAQKQSIDDKNNKKNDQRENEQKKASKTNAKVTSVNRGAFLIKDTPSSRIKAFKIPKSKSVEPSSTTSEESQSTTKSVAPSASISLSAKPIDKFKTVIEPVTSFSSELSKVDEILHNSHKQSAIMAHRDQRKSTDVVVEKARAPPRRNSKKLTFSAMNQHYVETIRLQEIQEKLAKTSSLKSPIRKPTTKKKTVRFNDKPEIRYIECVFNATRKVDKREPSTYNERKMFIRKRFPIVDQTEDLLSNVLSWSELWIKNKKSGLNADTCDDMLYPVTNCFNSVMNYHNTIFPLLKVEYLSHLERSMQRIVQRPRYNIRIDYLTQHRDRELMFAKCSTQIKSSDLSVNDLALIEIISGSHVSQCFGYVGNIRKADSCNCITIEISRGIIDKENLKSATKITIQRVIEAIRVYFGSFNAVFQLDKTPLLKQILNPIEILNVRTNWKKSIQYKGCDPLNEEQKEILLKTYAKAIDEYCPNISLIEGPPGTGKSRLITNLALQLLYGNEVRMLDKKILICAQSNMAVDVIACQLYAIQKKLSPRAPKYQVIRFGKEEKIHESVRDITVSKLISRDREVRLRRKNVGDEPATIQETLKKEILQLEARVAEMERHNLQDVRQDELIEMKKALTLKKNVQNQSLQPEDEKRLNIVYLENANIICTTLSSCVKLSYYVNYFDVCIIDEATQCIEPWTIMPLKFGVNSLIMVGDTQQLPATVISQKAKDYGLGTSLFTRIQKCLENYGNTQSSPILSLHTQYRMHPAICKWPNMYFYKNQLLNAPNTSEFTLHIKPFSIFNLEYRQNDHCYNGQIANSLEAAFVAKLVKALDRQLPTKFFSYGVITPYAQHREKLEPMIRQSGLCNVMVNTIDSYQGIEKDVIIISNARTQGVGFLANYQRLNVALTRPKRCLILCGSFKNLESVPSWASLLKNARERGVFYNISTNDALDIEKNVIDKIKMPPL